TSQPVTVTVNCDTKFESNETFFVNLSNPTGGATISDGQGQGTIVNDDTAPTLAIDDVSQAEGSTGGTTAFTFTVTKTGATAQSVTVGFTTVDGTATGNSSCATAGTGTPDYISQTGTLTFAPSDPSKTITVQVCADTTFELSEAFTVKLSGATGATITKDTGTGTIVNDDTAPTLAIDDVSQAEGSTGGTTAFTFTVTKTGATTQSVTVGFTTVDGTATGNSSCATAGTGTPDYISQTGTLTFAPSDPSKTITVQVCADTTFELSEAFTVKLSGATGATITKDTGTGTIVNDDTAPTLAIDDVSQAEGSTGGTTAFTFTVTKTGATAQSVTVGFTTVDGTATGNSSCAAAGTGTPDYISQTGTLTFAPSDPSKTITVQVCADTTFELSEAFTVKLSGATNATITKDTGTGTIVNDDTAPTLAIDDVSQAEGSTGGTTAFTFTVTKTGATAQSVTVGFTTVDGTATGNSSCAAAATGTPDYISQAGTLTFAPSDPSKTITVQVCADTTFELSEAFTVKLSGATNATITKDTGTGTIVNDDTAPTLAIDDVSQAEGSTGGTTAFTFTVTKTGATAQSVTVGFTTVDGTATGNSSCAAAGTGTPDYISQTGTLTFAPSDPSKTITVQVCADTTFELSEAFTVKLSGATGATITKDTGTGTIVNDDTAPTLAIDDVSQAEGSTGGTTAFTFTVTKTGATTQSVTVGFTTVDGTATGNSSCAAAATGTPDYISQTGTLTFAPSDPSKTITVQVCADTTFELSEAFTVKLSGATGATLTKDTGTGTIVNDDTAPTLAIDDVSQAEGSTGGTTAFTFTVTKTGATAQSVTVGFTTVDGTATGNSSCATAGTGTPDYISQTGTLTFAPSDPSKTITVQVCADTTFELSEAFTVKLSGATGATITKDTGTGTIVNDDTAPTLAIDDVSQAEGSTGGTTAFTFTVTKTGATTQSVTVGFTTVDGT